MNALDLLIYIYDIEFINISFKNCEWYCEFIDISSMRLRVIKNKEFEGMVNSLKKELESSYED